MSMKIWFIAALFLAACVGFSFQEELENSNDAPLEDDAQDPEENFDEEAETDLEDPARKGWRPFCPKFFRRKCFYFKNCYKRRRFCVCVKRYYGDETEYDNQVNDEVAEDETEEFDETDVEDPSRSKYRRRCPRYLRRKCVVVKLGYKKRRLCFCVRRCYGDEALNDNQLSDKIPEDETEALEENTEDEQMDTGSDLEDPIKGRRRVCPKNRRRKCYYYKSCYKRRRFCVCVKRRYGDETEYDNQENDEVNDETTDEDEAEELEEAGLEDPAKGRRRRRCPKYLRRKCFVTKRGKKKRRFCICVYPCYVYGDETANADQVALNA